jgi:hypothetical protein
MPLTESELLRHLRAIHPSYANLREGISLPYWVTPADIGRAALACLADPGAPAEQHGFPVKWERQVRVGKGGLTLFLATANRYYPAPGVAHLPQIYNARVSERAFQSIYRGDLKGLYLFLRGGDAFILAASSSLALARRLRGEHGALYALAGGHPLAFAKGQYWRPDSPDLKQPL